MCSGFNIKITLVAELRRGQNGGQWSSRGESPDVFGASRGCRSTGRVDRAEQYVEGRMKRSSDQRYLEGSKGETRV